MARYNTVSSTSSVAGGSTITTPSSGLLTTLTGTGTVTVPNPVFYTGQTQTYYNSTGNNITLTTPSGVFNGPGTGSSANLTLPGGSIITVVSDGTNYVAQSWLGGSITVNGTFTASSTVAMNPSNANVSIQPTGTGTLTMSSGATGTLDNVNIGATTQGTGSFTTLAASGITQITASTASTAYNNGALVVTGGVGVGGKIFTNNLITAGNAGSTTGSIILQGNYGNGALVTFGSEYSSGGPSIGYSVYPSSSSAGTFLSSTGITNNRSAYTLSGQTHTWYMGTSQTVAVGSAVSMYTGMSLTTTALTLPNAVNVTISNTASSPTNSQNPPGVLQFIGQGWNTLSGSTQYQAQIGLGGAYSSGTGSVEPAITFSLAGTGNSGYNASAGPTSLTERVRINNYGNIGVGTTTPQVTLDMGSRTDAILLPSGTSAQRPSAVAGMMRYNSTSGTAEVYSQGSWNAFGTVANGLTATTPFTKSSDMVNQSSNGTYWIQTKNMTSAQQYYVDYTSTTGGPWVRIFLASTDNYNQTSYSWDNAQSSNMLLDSAYFMYAFVNSSTNALTYPWAFRFNDSTTLNGSSDGNKSAFLSGPPMGHGGSGSPLITYMYTIRLTDSTVYSGYLRTGVSSFGSLCDDGRSGIWGQICLKAGGSGGSGTGSGGYSDFPHFTSFAYSGTDNWAQSNQSYTTNSSDSNHRFGVYCKLV